MTGENIYPAFLSSGVNPRVCLLKPGSVLRDQSGKILDARSSVTLVLSASRRIVIDTGLRGEGSIIEQSLAQMGLNFDDIDIIINTHSHLDHTGNNDLFRRAMILSPKEGDMIVPGISIMETPGHSIDSISVNVKSRLMVVIAGDALPTFDNYIKEVPPAIHIDKELAVSSMSKIIQMADVIIPGHDHPFSTYEKRYVQLRDCELPI